jgi:hypothetical protein
LSASRSWLRPAAGTASRFALPVPVLWVLMLWVVMLWVLAAGAAAAQHHDRGVGQPGGFNRGPMHEEQRFHPDRGPAGGFSRQSGPRPVQRVNPGFTPQFNPQTHFRRGEPGLPLNNPETLRPNVPRQETAAPAPAGGAVSPGAAGADPGPSPAPVPAVTAPARQVVTRPLPPPTGAAQTRPAVERGRRFV